MSGDLTGTYSLPFGFKATFLWSGAHLQIEWQPRFPRIEKHRAWRRFFAAHQSARRDFYQDVAATIGGNILIADTDLTTINGMEVISAPTRH